MQTSVNNDLPSSRKLLMCKINLSRIAKTDKFITITPGLKLKMNNFNLQVLNCFQFQVEYRNLQVSNGFQFQLAGCNLPVED